MIECLHLLLSVYSGAESMEGALGLSDSEPLREECLLVLSQSCGLVSSSTVLSKGFPENTVKLENVPGSGYLNF